EMCDVVVALGLALRVGGYLIHGRAAPECCGGQAGVKWGTVKAIHLGTRRRPRSRSRSLWHVAQSRRSFPPFIRRFSAYGWPLGQWVLASPARRMFSACVTGSK